MPEVTSKLEEEGHESAAAEINKGLASRLVLPHDEGKHREAESMMSLSQRQESPL